MNRLFFIVLYNEKQAIQDDVYNLYTSLIFDSY